MGKFCVRVPILLAHGRPSAASCWLLSALGAFPDQKIFLSLVAVIRGMIFVAPTSAEHLLRQQKSLFSEVQVRQTLLPVFAVLIL